MGVVRYIRIEERRGENGALWYSHVDGSPAGILPVVTARRCATPQICAEPPYGISIHAARMDVTQESCVVDGVEGLGEVHRHRHRAVGRKFLIKTGGYLLRQWQERCGGGASRPKAVLCVCKLNVWSYKW